MEPVESYMDSGESSNYPHFKWMGVAAALALTIFSITLNKVERGITADELSAAKSLDIDPETVRAASSFQVSPTDLQRVRTCARKLTTAAATKSEVDYLCEAASKSSNLSIDAFAGLSKLEHSPFRAQVIKAATKAARTGHENTAYAAIELLHRWRDPSWKSLALRHAGEQGELFQTLVAEAETR